MCLEVKPCPCRHCSQHKPRHQSLGQGRQVRKETSILGTPRPYLSHCHLLQYSVQSVQSTSVPQCSDTPYLRLAPSQFPPVAQCPSIRKHRGGALQDVEGRPLDFHPSMGPITKEEVFSGLWSETTQWAPTDSDGLLQLLCLDACHPTHPKFSAGCGVPEDDQEQKGCSCISHGLT